MDFLSKLGQVAQSQPFQDALSQYAQSQALPVVDDLTWQILAQDPQNFSRNFINNRQQERDNAIQDRLLAQDAQRKDALRKLASGIKGTQIQGINPAAQPILDTFAEYATMTGDVDPLLKVLQQQAQASSPDAGGATGVLVNRLMADNPNLSFADALAQVQSGFRQGVTYQGGVATPIQGIGQALGAIKGATNYGGEMGTLTAQGELKPQIEADVVTAQNNAKYMAEGAQSLPKQQRAVQSLESQFARMDDKINSIEQRANSLTTGWTGSLTAQIAGTPAFDLKADVDTLLADAAFKTLQEMRDNSPTGGALGAVSERELALLQSAAQNLATSQSPEQFKRNLQAFKEQRAASLESAKRAYEQDYQRFGGMKDNILPPPIPSQAPQVPMQLNRAALEAEAKRRGLR